MAATEPRIVQSAARSNARIDIFQAGAHVIAVDAGYLSTSPTRHGLRAVVHLTRDQAKDLHAVLEEVLT